MLQICNNIFFKKKYLSVRKIISLILLVSFFLTQYAFFIPSVYAASSPWTQTDWSGGSGQTSWSDATKYDSASNITTSTAGQATLTATSNWYDASWAYRRKITFNNADQTENLTNFPVMVKLSSSNINYSYTQNLGQDIRFTDSDGTTLLSYEIEKWDETGNSFAWVKVPQIDGSSATDYMYIYYGNSAAVDGQSASDVWSNNQGRYHLIETTLTAGSSIGDSSTNNTDLAVYTGATSATGQIDGALSFSGGSGQFLQYPPLASYPSFNASATVDSEAGIASTSATIRLAQGFKSAVSVNVGGVMLSAKKVGTPTARWGKVQIQTDSGGVPSGTAITNGTSVCEGIDVISGAGFNDLGINFATPPTLSANTQYHLVLIGYTNSTCATEKTTAETAGNYMAWGYDVSSPTYSDGNLSIFDGTNWTADSGSDFSFKIYDDKFNVTNNFSVGAWIKTSNTGGQMILNKSNRQGGNFFGEQSYVLEIVSSTLKFRFQNSGSQPTLSSNATTSTFANGAWHQVIATYNGATMKIFLDGTLDNSVANTINPQLVASPFGIADSRVLNSANFNGSIDEAFAASTAFSEDWIAASYKSETDTFSTFASEEPQVQTSGVLTSSIFDTTQSSNWGTLTYTATTPTNSSVTVKARTSNDSGMSGATAFASCNAITSGSDISSNNCVTDTHRYVQYQLTLTNTDSISTPTFHDLTIIFSGDAPTISLTPLTPDPNTDSTPTVSGSVTEEAVTVSNVQFQMDSTSGTWSSCTADDGTFDEASETFTCTPSTALSDGAHTMYVRSTDNNGNTTSSGSESTDVFTIDTVAPISFELDSPGDNSYTNNERPTFRWKVPNAPDATTSLANYTLDVDNGDPGDSGQVSGDFSIGSIPTSGTTDIETSKYVIHFDGFSDSDDTNNYISIRTKSSADWTTSENDGKLKEGRRGWSVRATDSAGNTRTEGRTLFVDKTNPSIEVTQVNSTPCQTSACSMATTDKTPTVFGKLTDPLGGVDYGQTQNSDGPKVASGPKSIEVRLEKKNNVGLYDLHSLATVNLTESYWTSNDTRITDNTLQISNKYSPFSFTPDTELTLGNYRVILYGKDNVDLNSESQTIYLNIGSYIQVTTTEERQVVDEEIKTLTPTQQETIKQELEITKPVEPTKPSAFETMGNWLILTFQKILVGSGNVFNSLLAVWSTNWTNYTNVISTLAYGVTQGGEFVVNTTSNVAMVTGQALAFVFNSVGNALTSLFNTVGGGLASTFSVIGNIGEAISQQVGIATSNLTKVISQTMALVFNNIGNTLAYIFKTVGGGLAYVYSVIASISEAISQQVGIATSAITNGLLAMTTTMGQEISNLVQSIGENYNSLADMTPGATRTILNGVGSGVSQMMVTVGGVATTTTNLLGNTAQTLANTLDSTVQIIATILNNTVQTLTHNSRVSNEKTIEFGARVMREGGGIATMMINITQTGVKNLGNGITRVAIIIGENVQHISDTAGIAIMQIGSKLVTQPTKISNVQAIPISPTSVKISWNTNQPANGKVNWGYDDGIYEFEDQTDKRTTYHEFILTNLKPDTEYHYEVMSHNKNYVYDANRRFKTPAK